jgi:flagellar hook-associated protein 3 FlgL
MRVTFNVLRDGLEAIQTAASNYARAQWKVSSGRQMQAPSDDPAAAQRIVVERSEVATIDAYTRTSDTASGRLTALDSVLGDIVDKLTQATTAATSARGTTATQATRDAAAMALAGARDAIAGDINTIYGGAHLFSGSNVDVPAYVNGGGTWTYQGNNQAVMVDADRDRSVVSTLDGQAILKGGDATDVLSSLDTLIAAVTAGNSAAIGTGIDALGRAFTRAVQAQSQIGSDEASVADGQSRLSTLRLAAMTRLSKDQDANLANAMTDMSQAQTAYEAALGAVGTASRRSLLDYIS